MDTGRSASTDRLHLPAGLPRRDGDELAGLTVGEKVEALESGLLPGAGELLLGKADGVVEPSAPAWAVITRANITLR